MESPAPGGTGLGLPEPTDFLTQSTPDGSVYWDDRVFQSEIEKFFLRNWLCIGREDQLPQSGDFFTRQIGPESIIVSRDAAGQVHAFYNVCRHRGTRIVSAASGTGAKSFVCPYHSWTYGLDGHLTGAAHTQELQNFRREEFGLFPVRMDRWAGFLFVNFDDGAPSLRDEFGRFFERMDRFPIARLRLGYQTTYEVEANWKILVENYSECYHCAPVHPSLNRLTPYLTGENDAFYRMGDQRYKFAGGSMEFTKDFQSMTTTGYTKRAPLPGMTAEDRRRVSYHTLFPNLFFSLHPDYLMIHRTWPVSPTHSRVENEFYFDVDELARPGFDPSDATGIWDEINRQDWHVCELAQAGSRSRVWHGGRYSTQESLVCDFDRFVEEQREKAP